MRRAVMHNDFVLVGPPNDPAGIQGETSIMRAFAEVAKSRSPFISRGDESGTHQKEMQVWKAARVKLGGPWYVQAGSGMAQTLRMADQKGAYTLSGRGTYLSQRGRLDLGLMVQGDSLLF